MEVVLFLRNVNFYQTTWRHILVYNNLQYCKNVAGGVPALFADMAQTLE
jgi:hypothetical protein